MSGFIETTPNTSFGFNQPQYSPEPYERTYYKFNINLPIFVGHTNIEAFMDWLTQIITYKLCVMHMLCEITFNMKGRPIIGLMW